MPKAILEFNLPEEQDEFELAQNGVKYSIVLEDLSMWLRNEMKYKDHPEAHYNILDEVRRKLHEIMEENGINQ